MSDSDMTRAFSAFAKGASAMAATLADQFTRLSEASRRAEAVFVEESFDRMYHNWPYDAKKCRPLAVRLAELRGTDVATEVSRSLDRLAERQAVGS